MSDVPLKPSGMCEFLARKRLLWVVITTHDLQGLITDHFYGICSLLALCKVITSKNMFSKMRSNYYWRIESKRFAEGKVIYL